VGKDASVEVTEAAIDSDVPIWPWVVGAIAIALIVAFLVFPYTYVLAVLWGIAIVWFLAFLFGNA
jgi:hypothetical protein